MATDSKIKIIQGDITTLQVDAIVNAANSSLLGGGGVDGAIHRAAGPQLLAECRELMGCPAGEARLTRGYDLPARAVIHTVGPVWHGGDRGERQTLADCYRSCFEIAREQSFCSLAFPAISTGVYRFPKDEAASIALVEVRRAIEAIPLIEQVVFVCFNQQNREIYEQKLKN